MSVPPGPKTPQLFRLLKLISQPLDYLEDYGKRYGDFFAVGSSQNPFVYVSHPQAIQEIFAADKTLFQTGSAGGFLGRLLGDNSLLFLQGERHQQQRKLLRPPFQGERVRTYSQLICDITRQVTETWQVNQSFLVRPVMQEITLRVILKAVFGLHEGQRSEQLRQLLTTLLESLSSPASSAVIFFPAWQRDWGIWSPWGRFLRLKEQVDRLLYREIGERRERRDFSGNDILTLLMLATDEAGQSLSDEELRDELITLLVAGHETTASALTWALYWLHYLPEVEAKLRQELSHLATPANLDEVVKLPYLNALCSETLRIYPIALTTAPRILLQPLELMGYHFEPGMVLTPCIYLVHRREDIYPEPEQFKPERFLERSFSACEYFPFGGGNRRCIGSGLALLEMKLVLFTLMSRFEFTLRPRRPIRPVRRGLTAAPPGNLKMAIRTRLPEK